MKKSNRTLLGASLAAALGALILLGSTGTLAFWSDTASSETQEIQSGSLDLGLATDLDLAHAKIQNCAQTCTKLVDYLGGPIVPGDIITGTATVPVQIVGTNLRADFTVEPKATAGAADAAGNIVATGADAALASSISVAVMSIQSDDVAGAANASRTVRLGPTDTVVPVVLQVSFASDAPIASMGGKVSIGASYTLTQIAAK